MNSVMREIVQYWSYDSDVDRDWQRDPRFEGVVARPHLDPPDTVAEVLAAIRSGAKALLVMCTSRQNRYGLAGRITAAMADEGRVLVVYPDNYGVVARKMIDGLVPDTDVGHWKDNRKVTLCTFSRLGDADIATIRTVAILAGPGPRSEDKLRIWRDALDRLATRLSDKVSIEFALSHSCPMIANPDQVIDAGRMERR